MSTAILNEFTDPVSMDTINDPVGLPCCGNVIDRQSIIDCLANSSACPYCRGSLMGWDATSAPKLRQVASLIERAQTGAVGDGSLDGLFGTRQPTPEWAVHLEELPLVGVGGRVGRLIISNPDRKHQYRNLLIPVIDISGSMGGKPIGQVQFCIDQLLGNQNPNLSISIVKYQSKHEIIHIPRGIKQSIPLDTYGGTSFKAAFDGIIKVLVHYSSDALITSADVVFLTDGQDEANAQSRQTQMTEFRESIQRVWGERPITIHTIGFGSAHDFAFLNQIRVLGSEEGAYRFADPAENDDVLSQKINGVLAAVCQKSSLPITGLILPAGLEIINSGDTTSGGQGGGIYWVNMSRFHPIALATEQLRFHLVGQEGQEHQSLITLSGKYTPGLDEEWYSYLSDKLAAELTSIPPKSAADVNSDTPAQKLREIQIRIIRHRISVLGRQLSGTTYDTLKSRVAKLLSVLDELSTGQTISVRDMSDLKFGGRFKDGAGAGGLDTGSRKAFIPPTHSIGHSIMNNSNLRGSTYDARWQRLPSASDVRKETRIAATSWHNWHLVAHGRLRAFEALDSDRQQTLKNKQLFMDDNTQFTALGLAIATGNWKMVELIAKVFKVQSVLEMDDTLETACLIAANEGYSKTLDLVVNRMKLWQPEKTLIDSAYGKASRALRTVMSDAEINPHSAVINGETDTCGQYIQLVSSGEQAHPGKLDWRPLLPHLIKPTTPQIMCVGLLIRAGLLDPEAEISLDVSDDNGTRPEILWPAFIACERGLTGLFSLLVKSGALSRPEQINKQNLAGTSLLWIAACNRHIDLVCELIKLGADVNLANAKGNPPLIPCCQKGSKDIVRILLDSGAWLDVFNTNRDGAVLISCRNGQAEILDMLLTHLPDDTARLQQLSAYAEIDGFPPLFAAIELDKVEAAAVCLKYGTDLHWRTLPNNPVIPGATALHLACYYGRTRSVKFLLEKGLNPEEHIQAPGSQHDGANALHLAIKGGFLDIAQMILVLPNGFGDRCLAHTDAQGRTPGYYSNMSGNEHIKRELFTNHLAKLMGGMLQICGSGGESDRLALTEGCAGMLGQLVSPGLISPNEITSIRNDKGMTLLSAAIISGNTGIARELIKMGADSMAPDDYGITPEFWATLFGYRDDILGSGSQFQVQEQLDRISAAKKKSIQNKMLLELTEGFSCADFGLSDHDTDYKQYHAQQQQLLNLSGADMLIDRWMLGWGITPESARTAQDSLTMAHEMGMEFSLLGFLDKLQNKSVFPGGKQQIRQILWDARVHITKMIAANGTLSNLEPVHMMALYLYTANPLIYKQVNELLVAWDDNNVWTPFVHALYQGCHKLVPIALTNQHGQPSKELYRWVDVKFSSTDFPIGSEVEWPGFTICSSGFQSAATCLSRTGICFIIQDSFGKSADISKFSKYPQNQEVVFLPGSRFRVIRYLVANPICLAQANIRDTTFKMTDIELAKAESGRVPVVIELEVC